MINEPIIAQNTQCKPICASRCSNASGRMSKNAVVSMTPAAKLTKRWTFFDDEKDFLNAVARPMKLIRLTTILASKICTNASTGL